MRGSPSVLLMLTIHKSQPTPSIHSFSLPYLFPLSLTPHTYLIILHPLFLHTKYLSLSFFVHSSLSKQVQQELISKDGDDGSWKAGGESKIQNKVFETEETLL